MLSVAISSEDATNDTHAAPAQLAFENEVGQMQDDLAPGFIAPIFYSPGRPTDGRRSARNRRRYRLQRASRLCLGIQRTSAVQPIMREIMLSRGVDLHAGGFLGRLFLWCSRGGAKRECRDNSQGNKDADKS